MHLFNWLVPKKKAVEGLVMRISTADQVDYATITDPSDSDIWDALVQLTASYDSLYLTYGDKKSRSFIFVEYEDDQYRLEHDTPELGLDLTNVARVSQQVARDILIRFSKEHTVILDDHWKQEKVRKSYGTPYPRNQTKMAKSFVLNYRNHLSGSFRYHCPS